MKGSITIFLLLWSFAGFAQSVDTLNKRTPKTKQHLSQILGMDKQQRPLVLIDNSVYLGDIDSIDLDKFQSFDVMRDTTSAKEIYGKDAAHGVVLLKTIVPNIYPENQSIRIVEQKSDTTKDSTKIYIDGPQRIPKKPLFILDGVAIADIQSVNPSDIFSIAVIKNQKDVARYGAKGKNGVVVIITKQYAQKHNIKN